MTHRDQVTGERYHDPSYYVIAVGHLGKWSPYGGYDRVAVDPDDLYFATSAGQLNHLKRYLLGEVRRVRLSSVLRLLPAPALPPDPEAGTRGAFRGGPDGLPLSDRELQVFRSRRTRPTSRTSWT